MAEDTGDDGTTGGDEPVNDLGSSYGAKNVTVTFNNFLSNLRLRHTAFRPDWGQVQEITGLWAEPRQWQVDITPRDTPSTVLRSFTGEGRSLVVVWDGNVTGGAQVSAQLLDYRIIDLGPGTESIASPGGGGPPALLQAASSEGKTKKKREYPQPPVPWDRKTWVPVLLPQVPAKRSTATGDSALPSSSSFAAAGAAEAPLPVVVVPGAAKAFTTFGVLYQGHHPAFHPLFGPNYTYPGRGISILGRVHFSSNYDAPWGKLKAPKRITKDLTTDFPKAGVTVAFAKADDAVTAGDLWNTSLAGGSNILNQVNLGLFIGHSAAGIEYDARLGHAESYIPIYNSVADAFNWVGMSQMNLGSANLKWAAFYTCNLFRADEYRNNGIYDVMKNNEHLAMNSDLHIMSAYATEVLVRSDMGKVWMLALTGKTPVQANHTVLGAWKYVCRNTQAKNEAPQFINHSRSAYWPECFNDYIYGYGPQTDPDPNYLQVELSEDDAAANDLEP